MYHTGVFGARGIERGDGKPEGQARAILLGTQETIMGVRFLVSDKLQGVYIQGDAHWPKSSEPGESE